MDTITTYKYYGGYGKTHAIKSLLKYEEPADMEYVSACGLKVNHLTVILNGRPVDCKKCLKKL
jgi:hypothetical protein